MKCLILLAVILAPQPSKLPESNGIPKGASSQVGEQSASAQRNHSAPIHGAVHLAQAIEGEPDTAPTDENIGIQRKLVLFTGLLVVVGFITALVIGWQSWETRKASEAGRDNTELQKIGMRQWVVTGHWLQEPRYDNGQLSEVAIGIPIANETSYPLRLDSVVAEINGIEQIKPVKSLIAPGGDDIHTIWFRLRLEGPDLIEYNRNNFFLVIECSVTFIDVFTDLQTMTFSRFYRCGPQEFEQKDKYTKAGYPK